MNNQKTGVIRVKAAVADKQKVTFYTDDGDTVIIRQNDSRLASLLKKIIPITTRGEVAVVDLQEFSVYADFEKKTGGLVKFFKAAKKALASLVGIDVTKQVIIVDTTIHHDDVTKPPAVTVQADVTEQRCVSKEYGDESVVSTTTRETVVVPLKPVEHDHVEEDETIVAVIDGLVIPDVDKLKPLIAHAVKTNSTEAVHAFLVRAAAISKERMHSVVDLMRFLDRSDLPLAEDGSIIAYKILRRKGDRYVDCHSGMVLQRVGSYVCVDEKLVDLNRRNECSNGLHIARRGYLGSFYGDVCVLTKIAPEDVMVVPHGDPNKVRVKGYLIIGEIPDKSFQALKANRPMTDNDQALIMVRDAIKGYHTRAIEEVRIHGQMGRDTVVTPLDGAGKAKVARTRVDELTKQEKQQAAALDDATVAPGISPKDINRQVNQEIEKQKLVGGALKRDRKDTPVKKPKITQKGDSKSKTPVKGGSQEKKSPVVSKPSVKTKAVSKTAVQAAAKSAPTKNQNESGLSAEHKEALRLIRSGVSQSEASRKTKVSRRTIGRLVDKYGVKTSS